MNPFRSLTVLIVAVCMLCLSGPVMAVKKPAKGQLNVRQGPIYNPQTNSYFELRVDFGYEGGPNWKNAHRSAAALTYKGQKGRLAVVNNLNTLKFVREHFRLNREVWIGLRYFCKFRKLVWVTGELQPLQSPGMWARQWFRKKNVTCRTVNLEYMPVYVTSENFGSVVWQASGPRKFRNGYLVEYPNPRKSTEMKGDAKQ